MKEFHCDARVNDGVISLDKDEFDILISKVIPIFDNHDIVDPEPDYAKFTVYNKDDCLYTALFIKVDRDTNISMRVEVSVDIDGGVHVKSIGKPTNLIKFISNSTYQLFRIDDLSYAPNKANRAERIINHIKRHADLAVKRFDIIDASNKD